jgi:hypothetical protein
VAILFSVVTSVLLTLVAKPYQAFMSQAMLGLTVACARATITNIPPPGITTLAGIFLSTETRYGTAQGVQNRHGSELVELPGSVPVSDFSGLVSASQAFYATPCNAPIL